MSTVSSSTSTTPTTTTSSTSSTSSLASNNGVLSSPGIGSGLNVNSIVNSLVSAEKDPKTQILDAQQAKLQAQVSAFNNLKTSLTSLQSALSPLKIDSTYQGRSTTIGDSTLFSATASSISDPGNHTIEVNQLAQAQSLSSPAASAYTDPTSTVTASGGTLTFNFGTTTYDPNASPPVAYSFAADSNKQPVSVDIKAGATLSDVRDAINNANVGVQASIVDDGSGYRLVMKSASTGAANSFQVSVSEAGSNPTNTDTSGLSVLAFNGSAQNLEQNVAAQDAQLKIDGLSITRDSNTVDGAIHGVTLSLTKAAPGTPTDLTISATSDTAVKSVQDLVTALNDTVKNIQSDTSYNSQTGVSGVLLGDSSLRSLNSQLNQIIGNPVSGAGLSYDSLASLGVSVQKDGTYSVDATKLQAALSANPDQVKTLVQTVSGKLDTFVNNWVGSNGMVDGRVNSLNDQLTSLSNQRTQLDTQMTALQNRLLAQYSALDTLVATMKTTSDYLTQQLASLPSVSGSTSKK